MLRISKTALASLVSAMVAAGHSKIVGHFSELNTRAHDN